MGSVFVNGVEQEEAGQSESDLVRARKCSEAWSEQALEMQRANTRQKQIIEHLLNGYGLIMSSHHTSADTFRIVLATFGIDNEHPAVDTAEKARNYVIEESRSIREGGPVVEVWNQKLGGR